MCNVCVGLWVCRGEQLFVTHGMCGGLFAGEGRAAFFGQQPVGGLQETVTELLQRVVTIAVSLICRVQCATCVCVWVCRGEQLFVTHGMCGGVFAGEGRAAFFGQQPVGGLQETVCVGLWVCRGEQLFVTHGMCGGLFGGFAEGSSVTSPCS